MRLANFVLVCVLLAIPCKAVCIIVDDDGPADYSRIQDAINVAYNGDVIILSKGRYTGVGNRDIDFGGKAITVSSICPDDPNVVAATIIDCEGTEIEPHRGFYFRSGEGSDSVLDGLTITNGFAHNGGGIICDYSSPLIRNCSFINCYAEDWGGGFSSYQSSAVISSCTFLGNSASEGGAITVYNGNLVIEDCQIKGNTAFRKGGGVNCEYLSKPTILDCTISGNFADEYGGGGISIFQSNPTIHGCTITDNWTDNSGGGILQWYECENGSIITNCSITGNTSGNYGGGICGDNNCDMTVTDCTINNNRVTGGDYFEASGGGVYSGNCSIKISRCIIMHNKTEGNIGIGAGICGPFGGVTSTIENCLISHNRAEGLHGGMGGGALGHYDSVSNCTIVNNVATDSGGGLDYCYGTITNCIVWGNYSHHEPQLPVCAEPRYSCIESWTGGGVGNIDTNPMIGADGYRLESDSPCINAGDPAGDYNSQADIDGEMRVQGGRVDIGADEYTAPPTPLIGVSSAEFEFNANEGGQNPAVQILGIQNIAVGTLVWEITEDCPWIEATPANGETTVELDKVTLSVDISGLTEDIYYCSLIISDPCAFNSPQAIDISLVVKGPTIELSNDLIEFFVEEGGTNPPDKVFTIRNSGGLTLDWQIAYESDWLSVDPCHGSSSGQADEVTLSVDANGLTPSHSNCVLTVSSAQASNSPQTVKVILHVVGDFRVPQDYPTIQAAIDATLDGDVVVIEEGIYRGAGNRDLDLRGKAIIVRSTNPDDSSVVENTIIDCQGTNANPHRGFRINSREGRDSVLSGFTITNGFAPKENHGGGMISVGGAIWCRSAGPTIEKCRILNNIAGVIGGGVYGWNGDLRILQCEITNNSAGAFGGGIHLRIGRPEIINCDIENNSGGGIYMLGCEDPLIRYCKIISNSGDKGGGIYTSANHNSIKIDNCIICSNSAGGGGGILLKNDYVGASITNCTISGNSAIYYGGGVYEYMHGPRPNLKNCIVWGNSAPNGPQLAGQILISYSDIQGGYSGAGNINLDPQFRDPDNFDFHLLPDSPCIDRGRNSAVTVTTDFDGNPRIINGVVDMGPYELVPNTLPVADAGADQAVYAWIDGMADVKLDASGSYDADGDELEYFWFAEGEQIATGEDPNVLLSVGEHIIELFVDDETESSEPNDVVINVIGPVETDLHIFPHLINRRGRSKRIFTVMGLPDGIYSEDIADETIELYAGGLDGEPIGAIFERVIGARVVALFDKAELMDAVGGVGEIELTVVGRLESGQYIYGSNFVRIIRLHRQRERGLRGR